MKRIGLIIIILLLSVVLAHSVSEKAEPADLTLMIYMTGSDLESLQGQAKKDIDEMLSSGYDPAKINILLYTGGCRRWKTGFSSEENGLYLLSPAAGEAICLESRDKASMGDPDTLRDFLNYAYTAFPAGRYALILWNHGAGPLGGVCFDELSAWDSLSLPEIASALNGSPFGAENKLSFIGFDACLMACAEAASVCAPYAEYMIASEEPEPGSGWNYGFVGKLTGAESGDTAGTRIVDCFRESLGSAIEKGKPLTLAVFDLSMTDRLNRALDRLFSVMNNRFDLIGYSAISRGRDSMRSVARATGTEYDLVDLRDMAGHYAEYAPDESAEVLSVLEQMTPYSFSTVAGDHGLSTYYPYYNKQQYRQKSAEFFSISPCNAYSDYISTFSESWMTGRTGIWKGLMPYEEENGYALDLSPEQTDEFAYAQFTLAEDQSLREDEQYSFIYRTDDVTLDESGVLYAEWDKKALFCVNSAGELLAEGSLVFSTADDMILVPAELIRGDDYETVKAGGDIGDNYLNAWMRFRRESDDSLTLIDVLDMSAQSQQLMTQFEVDLSDWEQIAFPYLPVAPAYDDDGIMRPYSDWERTSWIIQSVIDINEDWRLCFSDRYMNSIDRIAVFTLYDVHGNAYGSEILHISNPNIITLSTENRELMSTDRLNISLTRIELHTQPENAYVLHFHVRNLSDEDIELRAADPVINGRYSLDIDRFDLFLGDVPACEAADLSFTVSEHDMSWLPRISVDSLQFTLTDGESSATCALQMPDSGSTTVGTSAYNDSDAAVCRVSDDVFFRIQSCEMLPDKENLISFKGILVNESGLTYSLGYHFGYCNVHLNSCLLKEAGHVTAGNAQPHTEAYAEITVSANPLFLYTMLDNSSDNPFASLFDLRKVDVIALINETDTGGNENILLTLPFPADLSAGVLPSDSAVLARTDSVSVRLLQAIVSGDRLKFAVRIDTADEGMRITALSGKWSGGETANIYTSEMCDIFSGLDRSVLTGPDTQAVVILSTSLPEGGIQPGSALEFAFSLQKTGSNSIPAETENVRIEITDRAYEDLTGGKRVPSDAFIIQ
ncbi:MAG: clostripain-related cysteine peptidase [Clostridia bacterium]|nr:clostripain-related cysteine peptidase [Clostridia bacterium]